MGLIACFYLLPTTYQVTYRLCFRNAHSRGTVTSIGKAVLNTSVSISIPRSTAVGGSQLRLPSTFPCTYPFHIPTYRINQSRQPVWLTPSLPLTR
ncbi:hypothetical protein BZA05DRAFT_387979 [Tricharina praecox]|uniref:uncharacterized protein n=1 Tax=Tricharina praecox TaxID=43433 RepID=UPI00221E99DD|nr:uncharacterized protein BZA05DRAFT_387979 [Tricharina praecox]KAI5856281.1 hypothetical protein BZA05DRAFT_387979 [Tricharina praecox]